MTHDPRRVRQQPTHSALSSVLLFGFGIAVLLFLTAIEHQSWFELRPASGTAAAMANAASRPIPAG